MTGWWVTLLSILGSIIEIVAIVHVLRQRREPMAMLAWVLALLLVPIFSAILYFLIGERRVRRRARKKRRRDQVIQQSLASRGESREDDRESGALGLLARKDGGRARKLAQISTRLGDFPLTMGNEVEVYSSEQRLYDSLLAAIASARHHIHLEYYIFRPDATGASIRDSLIERARNGVEVRLLLDGIGSWWTGRRFLKPLTDAGALVKFFSPAVPFRRPRNINCRNHRKVVVIDGSTAFTGSQNIGDEYRGLLARLAPWIDTHLRIRGPAARHLQEVFIEDWFFASREDLTTTDHLRTVPPQGDSLVQVLATGPDQEQATLTHIFFSALSLARKKVRITTPYFSPDTSLLIALQNAAYRGVEVEILIPAKTDHRLTLWAGRSYYQELLAAGVVVHEFDDGVLHSKTVTIDEYWSLIGSANMDRRSFSLNFEVTATIFDEKISRRLAAEFDDYVERSRRIPKLAPSDRPFLSTLLEGFARLFSPLL